MPQGVRMLRAVVDAFLHDALLYALRCIAVSHDDARHRYDAARRRIRSGRTFSAWNRILSPL